MPPKKNLSSSSKGKTSTSQTPNLGPSSPQASAVVTSSAKKKTSSSGSKRATVSLSQRSSSNAAAASSSSTSKKTTSAANNKKNNKKRQDQNDEEGTPEMDFSLARGNRNDNHDSVPRPDQGTNENDSQEQNEQQQQQQQQQEEEEKSLLLDQNKNSAASSDKLHEDAAPSSPKHQKNDKNKQQELEHAQSENSDNDKEKNDRSSQQQNEIKQKNNDNDNDNDDGDISNIFSFASGRSAKLDDEALKYGEMWLEGKVGASSSANTNNQQPNKKKVFKAPKPLNNGNNNNNNNNNNQKYEDVPPPPASSSTTFNLFEFASGKKAEINEEALKEAEKKFGSVLTDESTKNNNNHNNNNNHVDAAHQQADNGMMFSTGNGNAVQQPTKKEMNNMNRKFNNNHNDDKSDDESDDDSNDHQDDTPPTQHKQRSVIVKNKLATASTTTSNNNNNNSNTKPVQHQTKNPLGGITGLQSQQKKPIGGAGAAVGANANKFSGGFNKPKTITPVSSAASSARTSALLTQSSTNNNNSVTRSQQQTQQQSSATRKHHNGDEVHPILDLFSSLVRSNNNFDDDDNDKETETTNRREQEQEEENRIITKHKSFDPRVLENIVCHSALPDIDDNDDNDNDNDGVDAAAKEDPPITMMSLLTEAHFGDSHDQDPKVYLEKNDFVFSCEGLFEDDFRQDPIYRLFFEKENNNNNHPSKPPVELNRLHFRNALLKLGLKSNVVTSKWIEHRFYFGLVKLSTLFFHRENLAQQQPEYYYSCEADNNTTNNGEDDSNTGISSVIGAEGNTSRMSHLSTVSTEDDDSSKSAIFKNKNLWLLLHPLALLADMISVYNQEYLNGYTGVIAGICTGDRMPSHEMVLSVCALYRYVPKQSKKHHQNTTGGGVIVRVTDGFYSIPLQLDSILTKEAEETLKQIIKEQEEENDHDDEDEDENEGSNIAVNEDSSAPLDSSSVSNHRNDNNKNQELLFRVGQKLIISNAKFNKLSSTVDHCTPLELPSDNAVALFVNKNSVKLAHPRTPLGWVHESIRNANNSSSSSTTTNNNSNSLVANTTINTAASALSFQQQQLLLQPPLRIQDIHSQGGAVHAIVGRVVRTLSTVVIERVTYHGGAGAGGGNGNDTIRQNAPLRDRIFRNYLAFENSSDSTERMMEKEKNKLFDRFNIASEEDAACLDEATQRRLHMEVTKLQQKFASSSNEYELLCTFFIEDAHRSSSSTSSSSNNNNNTRYACVEWRKKLTNGQKELFFASDFLAEGKVYRFSNLTVDSYHRVSADKPFKKLLFWEKPNCIEEIIESTTTTTTNNNNNNNVVQEDAAAATTPFLTSTSRDSVRPLNTFGQFEEKETYNAIFSPSKSSPLNQARYFDFLAVLVFTEEIRSPNVKTTRWWLVGQDDPSFPLEKQSPCFALLECLSWPAKEIFLPSNHSVPLGTLVSLQNVKFKFVNNEGSRSYSRLEFDEYSTVAVVERSSSAFWKSEVKKFKEMAVFFETQGKKIKDLEEEAENLVQQQQQHQQQQQTLQQQKQSTTGNGVKMTFSAPSSARNSAHGNALRTSTATSTLNSLIEKHFSEYKKAAVENFAEEYVDYSQDPPRVKTELKADLKELPTTSSATSTANLLQHQTSLGSGSTIDRDTEQLKELSRQTNLVKPKGSLAAALAASQSANLANKTVEDFLPTSSSSSSSNRNSQQQQHQHQPRLNLSTSTSNTKQNQQQENLPSKPPNSANTSNFVAPKKSTVVQKITTDIAVQTDSNDQQQQPPSPVRVDQQCSPIRFSASPTSNESEQQKPLQEKRENDNNNNTLVSNRHHLFGNFVLDCGLQINIQFVPHHDQQEQEQQQPNVFDGNTSNAFRLFFGNSSSKDSTADDDEEIPKDPLFNFLDVSTSERIANDLNVDQDVGSNSSDYYDSQDFDSQGQSKKQQRQQSESQLRHNINADSGSNTKCYKPFSEVSEVHSPESLRRFGAPFATNSKGSFYLWINLGFKHMDHFSNNNNNNQHDKKLKIRDVTICSHSAMAAFFFGCSSNVIPDAEDRRSGGGGGDIAAFHKVGSHVFRNRTARADSTNNNNNNIMMMDVLGDDMVPPVMLLDPSNGNNNILVPSSGGQSLAVTPAVSVIKKPRGDNDHYSPLPSSNKSSSRKARRRSRQQQSQQENDKLNDDDVEKEENIFDVAASSSQSFSSSVATQQQRNPCTSNNHHDDNNNILQREFVSAWTSNLSNEVVELSDAAADGRIAEDRDGRVDAFYESAETRDAKRYILSEMRSHVIKMMFQRTMSRINSSSSAFETASASAIGSSSGSGEFDFHRNDPNTTEALAQFEQDPDAISKLKYPNLSWASVLAHSVVITDRTLLHEFESEHKVLQDDNVAELENNQQQDGGEIMTIAMMNNNINNNQQQQVAENGVLPLSGKSPGAFFVCANRPIPDSQDDDKISTNNNNKNPDESQSVTSSLAATNSIPPSQEKFNSTSAISDDPSLSTMASSGYWNEMMNNNTTHHQDNNNNNRQQQTTTNPSKEQRKLFLRRKINMLRKSREGENYRRENMERIIDKCGSPYVKHLLNQAREYVATKNRSGNNNNSNKLSKSRVLNEKKYCVIPPILFWSPGEWESFMTLLQSNLESFRKVTLREPTQLPAVLLGNAELLAAAAASSSSSPSSPSLVRSPLMINNNLTGTNSASFNNNEDAASSPQQQKEDDVEFENNYYFLEWCGTIAPKNVRADFLL